jgi:thiol-disulfide isomerase/thioredoxin
MFGCNSMFYANLVLLALVIVFFVGSSMFEKFAAERPRTSQVVYLFMEGCGHCKRFRPQWDEFVKKSTSPTLAIERADPKSEPYLDIARQAGIFRGYPTVFFLKEDGSVVKYEGNRTAADLLSWQSKIMG